jgi:hypothetical protein
LREGGFLGPRPTILNDLAKVLGEFFLLPTGQVLRINGKLSGEPVNGNEEGFIVEVRAADSSSTLWGQEKVGELSLANGSSEQMQITYCGCFITMQPSKLNNHQ